MIRIRFTAKRALNGHAIGDAVTILFSSTELTPGRKLTRDVQKSLSGRRETLLHNALRTWSVTTEPLAETTLDAVEEFLTAVEDGAQFEFEPWYSYGAAAGAVSTTETRMRVTQSVRAVLGDEQYSLSRLIGHGEGGQNDWYQVTFTVDEVPS